MFESAIHSNQRHFKVFHLNVFTSQVFLGNPATVVWQSNGLTTDEMQKLAKEFNTPEIYHYVFLRLYNRFLLVVMAL